MLAHLASSKVTPQYITEKQSDGAINIRLMVDHLQAVPGNPFKTDARNHTGEKTKLLQNLHK